MTCPVCAGGTMVDDVDLLGIRRCTNCGARSTLSPSSTDFDDGYFREHYATSRARRRAYGRMARAVAATVPGGHVLDIGCGAGGFLEEARRAALDGEGYDPSPAARAMTASRGFRVHADLRDARDGHYDAVTLLDVVAHVPEPAALVADAAAKLAPGGHLFVKTPARPAALVTLEAVIVRAGLDASPLLHRRSQVHLLDRTALASAMAAWGLRGIAVRRWPEPVVSARRHRLGSFGAQVLQRTLAPGGSLLGRGQVAG